MITAHQAINPQAPRAFRRIGCACLVGFAVYCSHPVFAAVNPWSGAQCAQGTLLGSCNWTEDTNWGPPVPPPFDPTTVPANDGTAEILFGGTAGLTPNMNANWNVLSVRFAGAAGPFELGGGGRTLTIQAGITNDSLNLQTIGINGSATRVTLGAPQTWVANSADLQIYSGSVVNFNGKALTIAGTANTTILPAITGSGALIKTGTGSLFIGQNGFNLKNACGVFRMHKRARQH